MIGNKYKEFRDGHQRRTVIETFADNEVPIRMAHLHMFLVIPQLIDAFLRKRHKKHVNRHTGDGVIFRFHVSVLSPPGMLVSFALALRELRRVRERLWITGFN